MGDFKVKCNSYFHDSPLIFGNQMNGCAFLADENGLTFFAFRGFFVLKFGNYDLMRRMQNTASKP
jgi:hypothetical protein